MKSVAYSVLFLAAVAPMHAMEVQKALCAQSSYDELSEKHAFIAQCFAKHLARNTCPNSNITDIIKIEVIQDNENMMVAYQTARFSQSGASNLKEHPAYRVGLALIALNQLFEAKDLREPGSNTLQAIDCIYGICQSYAKKKKHCLHEYEDQIFVQLPEPIQELLTADIDDNSCTIL